ncbi:GtrA family protein [Streptomyces sp. NPDC102467]|uniref:GtrA family protein n=1 Tax=Streptomyces sp. NPDC102467 TaxID=3366179 RepID=UPI00382A4AC2
MKSPLTEKPETATSDTPGPAASFLRFVVLGGGVGVLSSLAVPLLATTTPWAVSNAIITVVSTLLCTELHARFTFAKGRGADRREHWQSAGAAAAAYLTTCVAAYVLHLVQSSPGMLTEQIVYLGASGLAGAGRFLILRLYVFASRRDRTTCSPRQRRTVPGPVAMAA